MTFFEHVYFNCLYGIVILIKLELFKMLMIVMVDILSSAYL